MIKKFIIFILLVAALIAIVLLVKDAAIKSFVEKAVKTVSGLDVRIQEFKMGVAKPVIDISGIHLLNPDGFRDPTMAEIPKIYVEYDLEAAIHKEVHLYDLEIELSEFNIIKNEKGVLNLDSLEVVRAYRRGLPRSGAGSANLPAIRIDNLRLKVGKVYYKVYSKGGGVDVKEYDVNIDETFHNITDPYAVVSVLVVKAMASTPFSGMTDFDFVGFEGSVGATLSTATSAANKAVGTAKQAISKTADTITGAIGGLGLTGTEGKDK